MRHACIERRLNSAGFASRTYICCAKDVRIPLVYRDTRTDAQNIGRANTATSEGQRVNDELEYCLLGYKGAEYYDTGIVYCPYIPVMIQRTIGPNDFSPRVGLLTRYGVVDNLFGADLYYHLMVVQGLGQDFGPGITGNYL